MFGRDFEQQRANLLRVARVADANGDGEPHSGVVCRPVRQRIIRKVGVGDNKDFVAVSANSSTATANFRYHTAGFRYLSAYLAPLTRGAPICRDIKAPAVSQGSPAVSNWSKQQGFCSA